MIMRPYAAGNGLPSLPGWPGLPEISGLKGEMSGFGGQMLGQEVKRKQGRRDRGTKGRSEGGRVGELGGGKG